MTDYTKLVEALRCNQGNGLCPYADCEYKSKNAPICMPTRLTNDAADAIEALEKQIDSIENDKTNLEADIINLEIALDKVNTQLPKWGEDEEL